MDKKISQIAVRAVHVPYVICENKDDATTTRADLLATRPEAVLGRIWEL